MKSVQQGTYGNTFTGTARASASASASEGVTIGSLLCTVHQLTGDSSQGNTNTCGVSLGQIQHWWILDAAPVLLMTCYDETKPLLEQALGDCRMKACQATEHT